MTSENNENADRGQDELGTSDQNPSQVLLPRWLTIAGIFVGFVLIFFGVATQLTSITKETAYLVMCIGFSIILVCFGTYAYANASWWRATGAGAVAIILYVLLLATVPPGEEYVAVTIKADPDLVSNIRMQNSECSIRSNDRFTFFIKKPAARLENLENVTVKLAQETKNPDILLVPSTSILNRVRGSTGFFAGYVESELRFEPSSREIKSGTTRYVYYKTQSQDSNIPEPSTAAAAPAKPVISQDPPAASAPPVASIGTATPTEKPQSGNAGQPQGNDGPSTPSPSAAQTAPASAPRVLPAAVPKAEHNRRDPAYQVAQLVSDEEALRKEARENLLAADTGSIRPLMDAIKRSPTNHQLVSEAIQIVGQIVQAPGKDIKRFDEIFKLSDLQQLVRLSADENQVVRYNSVYVLSKLPDPELLSSAKSSLLRSKEEDNSNGIYNAILVISFILDDLDDKQQADIVEFLQKNVPTDKDGSWRLIKKVCKKADLSC